MRESSVLTLLPPCNFTHSLATKTERHAEMGRVPSPSSPPPVLPRGCSQSMKKMSCCV